MLALLTGHHNTDGHRILTSGEGVWHPQHPEPSFTYLEFHLDTISYNIGNTHIEPTTPLSAPVIDNARR